VREALRLLASQHLIVTTRGVTGGSFVAHPDAEQLSEALGTGLTLLTNSAGIGLTDLLELRRALEVPAAGLAAVRRTDANLVEIRAALFDPDIDDVEVMLRAHAEFHQAVAKATANPLFELVTRPLHQVSYRENVAEGLAPDYWRRIDADHRELLECIARRDAAAAEAASARHIDYFADASRR
jgi:DNA-binding FadR family transcriptional regulator